MQPENEPVLNFDQLSHCSRLFLIFTLFYLPTFEGFRILLLSFALLFFSLLLFLFCVVFLYKKIKVWTISLSFPIVKVLQLLLNSRSSIVWHFLKRNISYFWTIWRWTCKITCARNGRFLQIFQSSGGRGFVEGSLLRAAGEVTQSLKLPYLL